MNYLLMYARRCDLLDRFGEAISACPSDEARSAMIKVLLAWQRWACADVMDKRTNVTNEWAEIVTAYCTSLPATEDAWFFARSLATLDTEALK